ncbi:MAG: FUSC family protein, partial [Anaerolineales bacterium]|nr:FUSC family protein [Anaerolineales bacterium]
MELSRKAKEAIKTGLALVLVYGIALRLDWLNPYWAALAVAMISLQTAGESIHKGMDRMAGTIPGIIAGIIIVSMASQDRWAFMILTSLWIVFTTYMQLQSRKNPYFWTVAGFVCIVIVSAVGSSSADMFERITYRIVETAMGISVYTLVTVFIWPQTNAGSIKKACRDLMETQAQLCDAGHKKMTGAGTSTGTKMNPAELHQQELAQVPKLGKALIAEGSENYEIYELRHFWDRFQNLSMALMESLDRWHTGMADLVQKDVKTVLPGVNGFFHELHCRFKEIGGLLEGRPAKHKPGKISLDIHMAELDNLSHFERAAFLATEKELKKIEALTTDLLQSVRSITGQSRDSQRSASTAFPGTKSPGINFFIFDRDHLRSAAYAAMAFCVGFFIWIFVNPPGHSGWYVLLGIISFSTISTQQVKMTVFIKPITVAAV